MNRGSAYADQSNYTLAIADYNQALKLKPNFVEVYYNKASAYSSKREVKAAIENLRRAFDLDTTLREVAKKDPHFDNLRQDKRFQALVGP
jgi:tetratricopeptide (TPR) repeat protein